MLDEKGRCGNCRAETERRWAYRAEQRGPGCTWDELRARRAAVLASTDWTQLPDVPAATSARFAGLRQRLRDLTDLPDCAAALHELGAIEADLMSMTQARGD